MSFFNRQPKGISIRSQNFSAGLLLACLAGCGEAGETSQAAENRVETSGKIPVALADVPAPVMETVRAAEPDFAIAEASSETRDGRHYYDVEGALPNGHEIEFDLMQEGDGWRVVEIQRDLEFAEVPTPARTAFEGAQAGFAPARIIESRQTDGLIIYEFFERAGQVGEGRKLEVKFDGTKAELLTSEWAH